MNPLTKEWWTIRVGDSPLEKYLEKKRLRYPLGKK
jgi:hypothetical protein